MILIQDKPPKKEGGRQEVGKFCCIHERLYPRTCRAPGAESSGFSCIHIIEIRDRQVFATLVWSVILSLLFLCFTQCVCLYNK
jgi:hypothetical protein